MRLRRDALPPSLRGDEETLMVLCANLARRKDRRFVMFHSLQRVCEVPIGFFPAVDGEAVPNWKLSRYPKGTTKAGYAVRFTKRLALREFLRSNHKFLLYLEDDVVVTEHFDETVLEGMERDYEVLFLGGSHQEKPEGDGRWRRCRQTYDNHALLFSREGARKALAVLRGWKRAWSDREFEHAMCEGRIHCWCVDPWVAFQRQTRSDNCGGAGGMSLAEGSMPNMGGDDLAVLDAALNFSKTVVEYGSGGSTVHLAHRLKNWGRLISVEYNRDSYQNVKVRLSAIDAPVTYILCEPKPARKGDGPWRFLPGQMDHYVKAPRRFLGEGEADLVFVDGRERVRCALEGAYLLKPSGMLMIHDFWPRYRYRARLNELLMHFDYLFESPGREGSDPQGMAVFRKKE